MFNKKQTIYCFISCLCIVFFQNCGQDFEAAQNASDELTAKTVTIQMGEAHPKVKKFQKAGEYTPSYADHELTYNILRNVFGPGSKNAIQKYLVSNVGWATSDFGGAWSLHNRRRLENADCNANRSINSLCNNQRIDTTTEPNLGSSALREGRRIAACDYAASRNDGLIHALRKIDKKAQIKRPPTLSQKNMERAFRLFFQGRRLPQDSFFDAMRITYNQEEEALEGWRNIIMGLCLSPHWQVL